MTRLTRVQSAQFLNTQGYPITRRYFEKLCVPSSAQGPRVDAWFGGRALYRPKIFSLGLNAGANPATKPPEETASSGTYSCRVTAYITFA
jgi:hypothetical protein